MCHIAKPWIKLESGGTLQGWGRISVCIRYRIDRLWEATMMAVPICSQWGELLLLFRRYDYKVCSEVALDVGKTFGQDQHIDYYVYITERVSVLKDHEISDQPKSLTIIAFA